MLGKFGHRRKIDVLDVGIRNLSIVSIMSLELFRIVIARQIQVLQTRHNPVIHDFDNVRFLHVLRHPADDGAMFGQRGRTETFAISLHHFRKIEIHFVTRAVLH